MSVKRREEQRRIAKWSVERIARVVEGQVVRGGEGGGVRGVTTDTRAMEPGALFVALVGERYDAHQFVGQAFEGGAGAAMVHKAGAWSSEAGPVIVVEDTLSALQALGHALWVEATEEGLRTVALTGSNGKTTVKEMIAALLSGLGATFATPGNLNNHIGVPLTLCAMPAGLDYLVVEMGANRCGDIAELIEMAPGQVRVITSIGAAHLEGFGGLEGVRRGKSEIFRGAKATDVAIVPEDERERLHLDGFEGEVYTVGEGEGASVRVVDYKGGAAHPIATIDVAGPMEWSMPFPGRHHASNLGCALGALEALGERVRREELQGALDKLRLPGGRWRREEVGRITFIDDAYNANPTSMLASFEAFMQEPGSSKRVAVIGEMLELGGGAQNEHERVARVMGREQGLEGLIFVGRYAGEMARAAEGRGQALGSSDEVAERLIEQLGSVGGLVFLKASRGAKLEEVISATRSKMANQVDDLS